MTIEKSHGKARATLPRSSDLGTCTVPQPDPMPSAKRSSNGRFAPGTPSLGRGKGAKKALAQMMGSGASDPVAKLVAAAATATYAAHIAELPSQGSIVSSLVALAARHEALAGFFHAEAARLGMGSKEGLAALENASKQGQRAERLLVTALDIAKALAAAKPANETDVLAQWMPTTT